ncbi:ADF-H domain-containing protein [Trichoderma simmonsii]|uniref:ADF-H domain-containing protein n=1 Tax=Trichoderma simmonsii TaxID=1491479 RepID=A0A8G0L613_9HYPO|nr:ADF-H domain-containing protein [Trichoderma simmonsii]
MASESRLYNISGETKEHLRKFRLTTSRASKPQAVIYLIDKTTHEIHQDADKVTYTSLDEIADDLPDHAPRFILLSYPLTMVSRYPSLSICQIPIYIHIQHG